VRTLPPRAHRLPAWATPDERQSRTALYYLEQHFIKGHTWRDFAHFGEDLARFEAEVLDVREHHTTHQAPLERFAEEAASLTPLPPSRYVGSHELTRKVSWDCMVPYQGSRYSVPYPYAGTRVWLRPSLLVRRSDWSKSIGGP